MNQIKECPKCHERLKLTGFNKDATRLDGLQSWCRACVKRATEAAKERNVAKWSKIDPYTGKPYEEKG